MRLTSRTAPAPAAAPGSAAPARVSRECAVDLLGRLHDMHAGKRQRQRRADALPCHRRAQEPAAIDRRHEQRLAPGGRREPGLPQQLRDLRARIRPAVAERRAVGAGPYAAAIGNDRDQPAGRRQHAPHLAQQTFRIVGHFQRMHQQDAVDRGIRQRHTKIVDQGRQRRPRRRPFQHALRRRHEGDAALAVLAEQPEIGRRIAEAEHALALPRRPSRANAAIDQLPRHDAEALRIEVAEVDDIHAGPI